MSKGQILLPLFIDEQRVPDYYFDRDTDVIYFRKSISGKIVKFTTHIKRPNIVAAKRYANSELKKKLNKRKNVISTLVCDELEAFKKIKDSENLKRDTLKNIRNGMKRIEGFWGERYPHEITADNIPLWFEWLKAKYPGQQKENAIKVMRMFTRYLANKTANGVPLLATVPVITDPDRQEVRAARTKRKQFIIDGEDFKKIYNAGTDEQKILALFMYTMASRVDETLKLRFNEEIFLDENPPVYRWTVGQNKANLTGEHALHTSLLEPLRELRLKRLTEHTKLLFPQITNPQKAKAEQAIDWAGWRERAKVPFHWTSHTFRHSCLSYLFNDESNPQILICKLYRVSLAVAFETYIKPTKSGILKMQNALKVDL